MSTGWRWGGKGMLLGAVLALVVAGAVQWKFGQTLRQENRTLRAEAQQVQQLREQNAELQQLRGQAAELDSLRNDRQELLKLRNEVRQLRQQAAEAGRLRTENQRLQTEYQRLAGARQTGPLLVAGPDENKRKEDLAMCINNLKQVGLAARLWANDNNEVMPRDFLTMSNELASARVLVCPADPGKANLFDSAGNPLRPLTDWAAFEARIPSYQMVGGGLPEAGDPNRVFAFCPFHKCTVHFDGSVQSPPTP